MARKPDADSFMDMFARFGRDLKMPGMDVDSILAHHRKNIEALEKSAKATAEGTSSLISRQRQMLEESLHQIADMTQNFKPSGDPREMLAKQADFARKSFEAAVKNAGEVAEIIRKSGSESVDILQARMKEAMDEIRTSQDKSG